MGAAACGGATGSGSGALNGEPCCLNSSTCNISSVVGWSSAIIAPMFTPIAFFKNALSLRTPSSRLDADSFPPPGSKSFLSSNRSRYSGSLIAASSTLLTVVTGRALSNRMAACEPACASIKPWEDRPGIKSPTVEPIFEPVILTNN